MTISAEEALAGVQSVIAAYAHAIDAGDAGTVADLFTEDGVSEIAGQGTFEGRAAIRAAYGAFKPQAPQLHLVGNTVLTSPPGEEVTATSNLDIALADTLCAQAALGVSEDTAADPVASAVPKA
ncbi:nuclear transport factor 2 family protein, partial [Streptomyces sp. NPDC004237]|uniref:nuclear transport factor 2 family protein n=1 Tax=Streptomyces sp. NPDC004237 TaxID=3154455 RepID=UPI00339F3F3D